MVQQPKAAYSENNLRLKGNPRTVTTRESHLQELDLCGGMQPTYQDKARRNKYPHLNLSISDLFLLTLSHVCLYVCRFTYSSKKLYREVLCVFYPLSPLVTSCKTIV